MLASLGHGTVSCSNHDDSTVHLSGTCYHVLNVVSVSGAVNVSIMTISGLILNVSGIDSNTTFLFLGSVVDLVERLNLRKTFLSKHSGDCGSQSGLTMVNVADSTDVNMRFRSFEFLFSHNFAILFD